MNMVEYEFIKRCETRSDIQTHLPRLRDYARRAKHITEFGVFDANSTWALLAGRPAKMISYDIFPYVNPAVIHNAAAENGTEWEFREENCLDVQIEGTDLLFIDTWHHYWQLKAEFELHQDNVDHWIILHDTQTNAMQGSGGHPGMRQAVVELTANKVWEIERHWPDSNGLTVIRRIRPPMSRTVDQKAIDKARELSRAKFVTPVRPCTSVEVCHAS